MIMEQDLTISLLVLSAGNIGVIVAYVIHQFVKRQKEEKMQRQIEDLFEMHDVKDEDGVYRWYVRASLEKAIDKMADAVTELSKNVSNQTIIMEQFLRSRD